MMDGDGLLVFGAGIDLAKVPSLERKRVGAFVNYFALQSVSLLTEFAATCEKKFIDINHRIEKARVSLSILEAKLASINDLTEVAPTQAGSNPPPTTTATENASNAPPPPPLPTSTPVAVETVTAAGDGTANVAAEPQESTPAPAQTLDPAYQRYLRMAKVVSF